MVAVERLGLGFARKEICKGGEKTNIGWNKDEKAKNDKFKCVAHLTESAA